MTKDYQSGQVEDEGEGLVEFTGEEVNPQNRGEEVCLCHDEEGADEEGQKAPEKEVVRQAAALYA